MTQIVSRKVEDREASVDTLVDFSCAIAGLIFTGYKQTAKWSAELLVINYHGALRCYLVSPSEFQESHTFLFSSYYPQGISCADTIPSMHSFIGGLSEESSNQADNAVMATNQGLTAWRDLSVAPYYKLVTDYDREYGQGGRKSILKRISRISTVGNYFLQSQEQDGIFKMCLSPKGTVLATIHQSGLLGLWDVPSMKRKKAWPKHEQPKLEESSSNSLLPTKKRKLQEGQPSDTLADVNFWSETSLILARFSGALAVCSSSDLKNRLGDAAEQLDSAPRLTPRFGKGFLALEHWVPMTPQSSSLNILLCFNVNPFTSPSSSPLPLLFHLHLVVSLMRILFPQALYFITDSERFQPPRKKTKVMKHTYRLVSLHETTPQELYARRIQNEEYGEALAVAKRFALDTDLVYQTQWKKYPVSLATIQDYLSKITKRSWVLHECLERVPEDIDAARELLEYGLSGTDVKALITIGNGEDNGRFIDCSLDDGDETMDTSEDWEAANFNEDEATVLARRMREYQQKHVKEVDFNSLNIEQKELINCRLRLLSYLDRLKTYEDIKGGEERAARLYSEDDYHQFRSRNIVELAVEYARCGLGRSLRVGGTELSGIRLVGRSKSDEHHHPDLQDPGEEFFDDNPLMKRFRSDTLTKEMVTDWYSSESGKLRTSHIR
ncbi:putative neuroblastoma-amplified sequence [Apostichopus japonicus]|uniref:Putative neuroblastoma-amplified sequence n=1 Tax=Stichopus japonicus TaxID=307972 RepID=A0A2G8LGP4_STIJA|nr:putative neuroblastoma-amplified sequence [Apostichopus japonicus]